MCSFHIPPGSVWGRIKPRTMEEIGRWLAHVDGSILVGIDANAPKVDHPDITKNIWWWAGEPLLLGGTPLHHRKDTLRLYLESQPTEMADIAKLRPEGPLAISHFRGNKVKTACRYDFIYCTPDLAVESISYLYSESVPALSDHALVTALLRTGENGVT